MTQEEKQLLLKDLCARLPYGVICHASVRSNNTDTPPISSDYCLTHNLLNYIWIDCYKLRPYLRTMESMTEEEKREFSNQFCYDWDYKNGERWTDYANNGKVELCDITSIIDWFNEKHLDFRGLIPKGLALEAPEGMYKI